MITMQIATGALAKTNIHPWTHFTHDATGASSVSHAAGTAMVVTICLFVVAFAFSWGPLGWLVCIPPSATASARGCNILSVAHSVCCRKTPRSCILGRVCLVAAMSFYLTCSMVGSLCLLAEWLCSCALH